ncbi:MAG TPA: PorT family protein [Bryobacterales bacterium]|nr:PorT family protein [Bryobacterales bacterium]
MRLSHPASAVILLGLGAVCASGQRFEAGFAGGVPLTGPLTASPPAFEATAERWTVGPAVKIRLAAGFSLRLEALYRRFGYRYFGDGGEPARAVFERTIGRWEFPLLVCYRLGRGKLRPFVSAGVSLNRVTGAGGLAGGPAELRHRQALGYVAGAGFEIPLGPLRLAPEIRYTHWGDRNFGVKDAPLRSNLDQVDALVALRFPVR